MQLQHVEIFFQIAVFLFAISVHESAHAWTANRYGDPTATLLGRVSLNPIRHIDPIGTVLLPLLAVIYKIPMIGWAKPTPVDPRNFKEPVKADIMTTVAGPVSNMILAVGAVVLMGAIASSSDEGRFIVRNITQGYITDTDSAMMPLVLLLYNGMTINVLLAVFNLIPVPPLDGSHVLRHMLSEDARRVYDNIGIFGLLALFMLGGPLIRALMMPVVRFFNSILVQL